MGGGWLRLAMSLIECLIDLISQKLTLCIVDRVVKIGAGLAWIKKRVFLPCIVHKTTFSDFEQAYINMLGR